MSEEIKRDKFGEIIGETIETPGMVRWYSKPCHYYLKKFDVPNPKFFRLGLEHRIGDGAYIFDSDIEFDISEAPDLMDRIAEFNGLPKYTDLLDKSTELLELRTRLEGLAASLEMTGTLHGKLATPQDIRDILEGKPWTTQ